MEYTLDLPSTDPVVNARLGYALPTSILLAPYLASNDYFVAYTQAIDEVMEKLVRCKMHALANIRNMWVPNPDVETLVSTDQLIPFDTWSIPERPLLVKQVNFLGMKLGNSGVLNDAAYLAISRFLGQYWLEKGLYTCIDFLNFCLGTDLELVKLWTKDYETFLAEGDAEIGTPIWEGGEWYPTTHTAVIAHGGFGIDPHLLMTFFYDISNYNLVLWAMDERFTAPVEASDPGTCAVVATALLCNNSLVISTEQPYGADPPDINTFDWVSTQFYSNVGTEVSYFLGQPSGWFWYAEDKKFPVYGPAYQSLQFASTLPTKCYGDGKILLGTKLVWIAVPGSRNSKARLPAYVPERYVASVEAYIREFITEYLDYIKVVNAGVTVTIDNTPPDLDVIQYVDGVHPTAYLGVSPIPLTSPKGFVELHPHIMVPYW